ncbi:unnamed protein product [Microthlaspi erraticum]|uniref:Uncharacterized protein n=1 Tax=Microthlaspi erraticum TaxID=1685480 RepID=A0A6D2KRS1_9BRAS|nr:unnamed protein product [Microthlaspi erraticum]
MSPKEKPPPSVDEEKEEPKGTHEKLVFTTPTQSPAASLDIAETETQENEETASKKRPQEEGSPSGDVNTKRVKAEENTNSRFQWSEEDEIVLLQEIKTFGSDPLKSRSIFYDLVESKISFQFTLDKLKQKFREKEKQKKKIFHTPHNKMRYEMAKEIWGSILEEEEEKKKNLAIKTNGGEDWFEKSFLLGSCASFGLGEKGVKEGWSLVSAERKDKIQEELRLSVAEEIRSMKRKSSLVSEVLLQLLKLQVRVFLDLIGFRLAPEGTHQGATKWTHPKNYHTAYSEFGVPSD